MMADRLLKSTTDGKLAVFKSGIFGRQNLWLTQWTAGSRAASFCFWWCEWEHRLAAV